MLPEGWQIESLGALLEGSPKNGYSPNCPEEPTGKWVLGLGALTGDGLDLSQVKPAPISDILVDRFQVHPGDFLISRSNTLDKVGRSALYRGGIDNCSYPDLMMRFRVTSSRVDLDYLDAYLRSERVMKHIQRSATGTSGSMKKINQAIVEDIPVILPSLSEQRQIAAILATWDAAIKKSERLIAAKRHLLHGLYQLLFGLSSHFRTGWCSYQLAELLTPRNERAIPSDVLPLYSLTIEEGVTPKTERYDREFLVKDANVKQYAVVYPDDIVFNPANLRWGAIARAKIDRNVVVSPIYEVLQIHKEKVNASLLEHVLTCPRQIAYFATKTEGTLIERMAVKLDVFLHSKIYLPIRKEDQDAIAALLDNATREIQLQNSILCALKKQKYGLMQKLLTRTWRVKVKEEIT